MKPSLKTRLVACARGGPSSRSTEAGSSPDVFGDYRGTRRATAGGLLRRGVGPAIVASGLLFALGHFPTSHPILPSLHFRLPGNSKASRGSVRLTGTINTPSTASVGSTLTFHGTAPSGNGRVTVEGSYDGGQNWQTLSSVGSANGTYTAQVTLSQRGPLQIQIIFSDGSKAVGSIDVR